MDSTLMYINDLPMPTPRPIPIHQRGLILMIVYLTIIPRVQLGSESIAHEAEPVGQKYRDKTTLASKTRFSRHCFSFQSRRFSLLAGYNI